MKAIVVIALLGAALALAVQLAASAGPAPAAAATAVAASANAGGASADASADASVTSEGDDEPVGADPQTNFFSSLFTNVYDNFISPFFSLFGKSGLLPKGAPEYVDGEVCLLGGDGADDAFRTFPITTRKAAAGCAKRGINCEWKSDFGQPLILASHPLFGEKINMWFYGLDSNALPKGVTGKDFAEKPDWTSKLLGTSSSTGMCNSFKAGDDDKVQYASCYSGAFKSPIYVAEALTPQLTTFGCKDGCVRYDKFLTDSRLGTDQLTSDDWTGTQMDRGHLAPNADANTTPQRMCTFYTSNIFFQTDQRNRLVWAAMEDGLRDSMYDKKKFSQVQFEKIHIYNSLVFTLPGVAGADKLYTMTTRRKNQVPVPYFAFKFVIGVKGKSALINICFLDNPDPNRKSKKAGNLATPYNGEHIHKCPKSAENAKAHCVALDEPKNLDEISSCFEASELTKMTVKELVKASQLDFAPVMKAIKAKGLTVVTNAKITEWQG